MARDYGKSSSRPRAFLHPKCAVLRMSGLSAFVRLYKQEGQIELNTYPLRNLR